MPNLMKVALTFCGEIDGLRRPDEIIDLLHSRVASGVGINVLSAWRIPTMSGDWDSFAINKDIFPHSSVPATYWDELLALIKQHGYADIEQHALRNAMPFTFTESMRENKPVGDGRWVYDLARKYGMRDGFIVPVGAWRLTYWSRHVLRMSPRERGVLSIAAACTIARLQAVLDPNGRKRPRRRGPRLSSQERQTILLLSLGKDMDAVAAHLGVAASTARTYRHRAQEKLNASSAEHAIGMALRWRLIS